MNLKQFESGHESFLFCFVLVSVSVWQLTAVQYTVKTNLLVNVILNLSVM